MTETIKVDLGETLPEGTSLYMGFNAKDSKDFGIFRMMKFDHLCDYKDTYIIRRVGGDVGNTVCNCPAYTDNCRHKRMLRQLIRFGGLDGNRVIGLYNKVISWYELPEPLIDPDLLDV